MGIKTPFSKSELMPQEETLEINEITLELGRHVRRWMLSQALT